MDLYAFLTEHGIGYDRVDHPPVFTCEQAEALVPPVRGANTKNLFVRDKKGRHHFLVAVGYETTVDLKALARVLNVSGLSLGSAERLASYLGVDPGSVSLLAIVNDRLHAVQVVVDESLWRSEYLKCHPLVNTSTLSISRIDVERVFKITGHAIRILNVPNKNPF